MLLGLIVVVGLFLRIWQLPTIPVGLHGDEASIGYNAYSLLKTGKDQNGIRLPLAIDQFGDFRPAGYHYLAIPFVKFLGLNALAVRLPSVLFGVLTIISLYLLMQELFKRTPLSLVSAGFLAISPWHINISRATSEGVVAECFVILGMWLTLKAIDKSGKLIISYLLMAFVSFLLSFLFYHAARLFVPIFLIPLGLYLWHTKKPIKQSKILLFAFIILVWLSMGAVMKFSQGAARPTTVSIFQIPGGDREIFQQIGEDGTRPALVTRFLHNKLLFYGRLFLNSYFWHFNGEFLFTSTGMPIRYKVPWSANMHLADLPLLLLGASVLLIDGLRLKKHVLLIPLTWLLIGALPAGLTWEDLPNIQRASLMIPGLVMITSYGVFELLSLWKKRFAQTVIVTVYGAILVYGFILFYHSYFYHLPRHEPWHRSAATPQLIETIQTLKKEFLDYPVIETTDGNNNFIFYPFYTAFDPATFQSMGSPTERDGMVFDGIRYVVRRCPLGGDSDAPDEDKNNVGILFVNVGNCKMPINAEMLATIRTPDGVPAYYVAKINPDWEPVK